MVLPDILKNAPFFKKIETKSVKQAARGGKAKQAATQRTQGARAVDVEPRVAVAHRNGRSRAPLSHGRPRLPTARTTPGMPPTKGSRTERSGAKNPSFN